ncbi:hypothetical protein PSPO01_01957 [Paraphaeosphaeria sporulosa]
MGPGADSEHTVSRDVTRQRNTARVAPSRQTSGIWLRTEACLRRPGEMIGSQRKLQRYGTLSGGRGRGTGAGNRKRVDAG